MHFTYVSRTIVAVLIALAVSVGTLMLSQGYTMMLQGETVPMRVVITILSVLVLFVAVVWALRMLLGLYWRLRLWRRVLDNRCYKTSHHTSVWMMPAVSASSKRSLRVRDEDGGVTLYTISRGLDIVESDGYKLSNLEAASLWLKVEVMRNNALAYEQARIRI